MGEVCEVCGERCYTLMDPRVRFASAPAQIHHWRLGYERSQEALAAARRECDLRGKALRSLTYAWRSRAMASEDGGDKEPATLLYGCAAEIDAALAAPADGEEGKR